MLTFPARLCEPCEEDDRLVPADHELDSWGCGSGGGGFVCDNCLSNMAEAAHERSLSAYYGSSAAQTIRELYHEAHRARREVRGYGHGV